MLFTPRAAALLLTLRSKQNRGQFVEDANYQARQGLVDVAPVGRAVARPRICAGCRNFGHKRRVLDFWMRKVESSTGSVRARSAAPRLSA
jgi:hypothetical protein